MKKCAYRGKVYYPPDLLAKWRDLGSFAVQYRKNRKRQAMRAATMAVRLGRYSPIALTGIAAIMLLSSMISPTMWSGPRMATIDALSPAIEFVGAPFRLMTEAISDASGLTQIRAENARLKAENKQLLSERISNLKQETVTEVTEVKTEKTTSEELVI